MSAKKPKSDTGVRVSEARFEAAAGHVGGLPPPSCEEVAFVGRSNVGKSSLMNALLERKKLVRTSSTPGCTRQINLFAVRLAGGRELRLVDLPGYGYAKLSKAERASWGERLEGYVRGRSSLSCVVLLVDGRRGFEPDDAQMAEFVLAERPAGRPPRLVIVSTKMDKLPKASWRPALQSVAKSAAGAGACADAGEGSPVAFSAITGEGREALWAKILAPVPGAGAPPITSAGQGSGPDAAPPLASSSVVG
jgi:GTP-binding protein